MRLQTSILVGEVTHKRLSPLFHSLKYRVFSILVELDDIAAIERKCRFFSHNRWNMLSLFDKDLADGKQSDLAGYAKALVVRNLGLHTVKTVYLLTYPRVFGYVFNPLSVYFCLDEKEQVVAAIYEVSNTFGERTNYVCDVESGRVSDAEKKMVVSPFNGKSGTYSFRIQGTDDQLTVGVALRAGGLPVIKTWFRASYTSFSDWQIWAVCLARPLMTAKVMAGIHFEALKLWLKGMRPYRDPQQAPSGGRHPRPMKNQPVLGGE